MLVDREAAIAAVKAAKPTKAKEGRASDGTWWQVGVEVATQSAVDVLNALPAAQVAVAEAARVLMDDTAACLVIANAIEDAYQQGRRGEHHDPGPNTRLLLALRDIAEGTK